MTDENVNNPVDDVQQKPVDEKSEQSDDSASKKVYTDEQVQDLIKKRVRGLSKKVAELEDLIPKKEIPAKKDDDPLTALKTEIATLKAENAQAKADKDAAILDKLKIKLAKGKFPGWFDPTLLRGNNEEEIEAAIDDMQRQMVEEAKNQDETRKKQSFGGPVPKKPGAKPTGDEVMNDILLNRMGRSRIR